ncbi:polymorphic toxin-type HINT domain-containing protein [Streptomyces sp. V1I6]|uniref:polymorphic toxin-type HINT domain-containing protein n=1 Tax=Streptomyces sp. V1I6 TaxID=3042273 RepID=UPI0027D90179|nr:polymorphic toxin-type HINT domain-containing protein [Streptomyces sp. V1I6]
MWESLSWSGRGRLSGTSAERRRRVRRRAAVVVPVALALAVGMLPSAYALPPDSSRSQVELVDLPEAQAAKGQDGGSLAAMTTPEIPAAKEYEPTKMAAPAGGSATEAVTGLTPGETVPVGTLPVAVGAPASATAEQSTALEGNWQVSLADQAELADTGIEGLVFTVTPPAEATGTALVAVDYTEFAELYGANWADRLQLVQYPSCFLTTPDIEGCSEPTEIDTTNVVAPRTTDAFGDGFLDGSRRIEATVDVASLTDPAAGTASSASIASLSAATGSGSSVLVASSSGSGAKGDFSATPLPSAGSWSAGTSSGAFSYSYAMQAPTVPAGPSPSLGFTYNSQAVDGRTSATNNQASWIGDGWDYNPGSITRTYRACRDDRTDGNNKDRKTGDLCWGSYNATLTLGGTTTELVLPDGAAPESDKWLTANGDGSRVELLTDTSLGNGDEDNGEYWRVTTRDGIQYYFGRHRLPGWSNNLEDPDDPLTDSVFSVPVAGNQPGEPCYKSAFADSFCKQAWRWNLDYVVDPSGSAMSLWWKKEINYFAQNLKFRSPQKYDRGGYLTRIDYGQRESTLFDVAPLARVAFGVDERCFVEDGIACTEANFTSGLFAKNRIWYDTPADLYCSGVQGKDCFVPVPSFWSRMRLNQVTTFAQRVEGSTALKEVDSWTLTQSLPAERTDEGTALWLESITRRGYSASGESIRLRPVTFVANTDRMPNRVKEGANDPNPTFDRLRIERVINEYGGETFIDYREPVGACASGSGFPAVERNTGLCFPAYWHPDPDKADESIDWFNKYVVDHVQELPAVKGVPGTTTSYEYAEAGDASWALNQAEFSKKKTRTYDQWRGYGLVRTITGADSDDPHQGTKRSMSETRYFRGMDDDPLPGGVSRNITVRDHDGAVIAEDQVAFQGRVAETLTYDGYDGNLVSRSVDYPQATVLATRTRTGGIPALKAYRVQDSHSITTTRSSGTRGDDTRNWRSLRTNTTYEAAYGLPTKVESLGDTGRSGDEACSVMSYVHNTAKHLIGLAKETLTTAGTCAEAVGATGADWISGARIAYDGAVFGAVPVLGLATTTWDISGSGGSWTQSGTVQYDSVGRPTSATDAAGNTSTTTYAPATGQVYKITTTNALNHTQTSEIEPGRGTTLKETDANGRTSSFAYDALGRATAGWRTSQSTSEAASIRMEYNTTPGEPVSVVTSTLDDNGKYTDSVVFYDGLGRERQRQQAAVGKGRLITDIIYSANGTIERTNNAYYVTGEPQAQMYDVASDYNVPNATLYKYDGAGRVLAETPYEAGSTKDEKATRYEYGFDYSTVINPAGAASQRTWSDALGRNVRVDTYTDVARTGTPRKTTYEYDRRGNQVKATDTKGTTWSWTYDARGRQTSATDPDTGTTTTTYDALDRPVTSTSDRQGAQKVTVWNGYDKLSRPTEQRLGSSTGTLLTSSTYDTVTGGIGLPASTTRYTDGLGYSTTITGYTKDYQPTGKRITLPQTVATLYGLDATYQYSYEYSEMGLPKSVSLPAAGELGAEKVITRYNDDGLPISTSGLDWYTAETNYSVYGEVLRTVSGEHPNRVWTTNLFDERTGELTKSIVDREHTDVPTGGPGHRVNARSYAYDLAGNVTKIEDTANAITDRQCFRYDVLGQLTRAWTSDNKDCATDPAGEPVSVTLGAAADGYHKQYWYDELGNRSEMADHRLKLADHDANASTPQVTVADPANDTKTRYSYGALGKQPHTLTGMTTEFTTDKGARVTEASTRTYDDAGNMVSRVDGGDEQTLSWTWDGKVEKVTGFGDKGAGAWSGADGKCLDLSSASTAPGTALQLFSCNGSRAQKLRIEASSVTDSSKGALKILGKCAEPKGGGTADGTAVVIADCTGADAQHWSAVATGNKLKHVTTGKCLAVPGTTPANGTDLVLSTCDTNGAVQSWKPANETTYVYGPGGERLMALTSSERVLYLGDTTISIGVNGAHSYSERYYAQPGAPTVMRHVQGTGSAELSMQVSDQTGSAYVNVKLGAGNAVKFNKLDPFGVKRSENATWRSARGFIGGDDDSATGLVHLGAREYDPSTGRFISADPVLDLADPVQMNGYVYCENNPVTFADPTGLASDGGGVSDGYYGGTSEEAWANQQLKTSLSDIILSVGWGVLKEFVGWDDVLGCFSRGDLWACGKLFASAVPLGKVLKIPAVLGAAMKIVGAINAWIKAKEKARKIIAAVKAAKEAARKAAAAKKAAAEKAAQLAKQAQEAATRAAKKAAQKTGNAVQKTQKAAARKSQNNAPAKKSAGTQPKKTAEPKEGDRDGGGGGSCSADNSFTPGTLVLMADGSTKPIEDVKNGDKLLATDPETGETKVETVTAEIMGKGVKHLVKVTIDTDGEKGTKTETVTATEGHPFWVPEVGKWLDAKDLDRGQWLRTSAGTYVQISAIERWTAQSATVHNLTVSDLHTYYVLAGATPVLVHNCGGGTTVFRGVSEVTGRGDPNPGFDDAVEGIARPRGGDATPERHHRGNTESDYTSWTTDPAAAIRAATRGGNGGVVLRGTIPSGRTHVHVNDQPWAEEDWRFEFEVIIQGEMRGDPRAAWPGMGPDDLGFD